MYIDDFLHEDEGFPEFPEYEDSPIFDSDDEGLNADGGDDDEFLEEVMNERHNQHDYHNTSFGKASESELKKLQSKVDEAESIVDDKKSDVHERQMQYNYNKNATTARRLSQAKDELANAKRDLENAKYKLNNAR